MISLRKIEWTVLIGLLLLSFIPSAGGIARLVELGSGSGLVPENPRIQATPLIAVAHILASVTYCVLGAFQFLPSIRKRHLKWHKLAGRLLILAGIVSAVSGLWMTHYYLFPIDVQGNLLYFVRIVVGFVMIACILLGLAAVSRKQFVPHQAWMIRAYALGQGAGTQVLMALPWVLTVGQPSGLNRDILMTLGWVINAIVAEIVIRNLSDRMHRKPPKPIFVRISSQT